MKEEWKLDVIQMALAIVGTILAIISISDQQVSSIFGISIKQDNKDITLVVGYLTQVCRVTLVCIILTTVGILFNIIRRRKSIHSINKNEYINVINQNTGIQSIMHYIGEHPDVRTLYIWGFSLNWASTLSTYLSDNPRHSLVISIFIPAQSIIGKKFLDDNASQRKSILALRISEWKKLVAEKKVSNVNIFAQALIPNDMGVLVDNEILLVNSYSWETTSAFIRHKRQKIDERLFLKIDNGGSSEKFLIHYFHTRFLCRQYDSIRLT